MTPHSNWGEHALAYARRGWRVIPFYAILDAVCSCKMKEECQSAGKHPRIRDWPNTATDDPATIEQWSSTWPEANVAIATGQQSGIIVIDIDPRNGGNESFEALKQRYPDLRTYTREVRTGGGGRHLYFMAPEEPIKSRILADGVDLKAEGGAVVAPPSLHRSGGTYEWATPSDAPLAPCPAFLRPGPKPVSVSPEPHPHASGAAMDGKAPRAATYAAKALKNEADAVRSAGHGSRNITLNKAAFNLGQLVSIGWLDREVVEAALLEAALESGLTQGDAEPTIQSGLNGGEKNPREMSRLPNACDGDDGPSNRHEDIAPLTEGGDAQILIERYKDELRFVEGAGWYAFDGRHWQPNHSRVAEACKDVIRLRRRQAARAAETLRQMAFNLDTSKDHARRIQEIQRYAKRIDRANAIKGTIEYAKSDPRVKARMLDFDQDPMLFNVQNATIDLRTGQARPHRREDLITHLAGVAYDSAAECPQWLAFQERIFGGDPEVIAFAQRVVGYCLTGHTVEQVMFLAHGQGANGKSVFAGVLRALMGTYATEIPADVLMKQRFADTGPQPYLARLAGVRLVGANEAELGQQFAEAKIKAITGGDLLVVRKLHENPIEFMPQFKLMLRTNHLPRASQDQAFWRRIRLIKFGVTIPEEERDHRLPEKLLAELPGILNWAIAGCLAYQEGGLRPPEAVTTEIARYRADMDTIGRYLAQMVDRTARTLADHYAAYVAWCQETGDPAEPKLVFLRRIGEAQWAQRRTREARLWVPAQEDEQSGAG